MQTVVVLGMHKSGTSLLAEMLHHSGIEMIETASEGSYDEGQKYERHETNQINKALLNAEGLYSLQVRTRLRPGTVSPQVKERARTLIEAMDRAGRDWGFKDPRTCLTYEFWRELLPRHKLVCVFRDFGEVHHRYRGSKAFVGPHVIDAWYSYNRAMLDAYQATPAADRILLSYKELMDGARGIDALGALLQRPITDRRNSSLRRTVRRPDAQVRKDALLYLLRGRNVWSLNRRLRKLAGSDQSRFAALPTRSQ